MRTLSKRMADLLAAVDDIAQDLREELDRLSSVAIEEPLDGTSEEPQEKTPERVDAEVASGAGSQEAARRYLRERLEGLSRPIDLASLAWELQREFGQEVSHGWFGFESFKSLVRASSTGVTITDRPPAYVMPADFVASAAAGATASDTGIPQAARTLKQVDKNLPLINREQLLSAYDRLAQASREIDWSEQVLDLARVNDMTRRARQADFPIAVSRAHLDYITKGILYSKNLRGPLSVEQIKSLYSSLVIKRAENLMNLEQDEKQALLAWLT